MQKLSVTRAGKLTLGTSLLLAVAACGGGGGDTVVPTSSTTAGVAAIGAPIVGGSVELKCASGATASATTGTDGAWTVSLKSSDYPCAARLSGGTANGQPFLSALHSVAQTSGTTNITPLTDLVTAILGGQNPATWYANAKSSDLSNVITASGLTTAVTELKTTLATLPGKPALPSGFDPLTSKFSAQKGDPGDDLLESYGSALTAAGLTQATATTKVVAKQPLTEAASSMKGFSAPKLTAVFAGSAKLQSGTTTIAVDDLHAQAEVDADGNITALASDSPFTGFISLFGNTLGQLCMSGAGSIDETMHSKYLFVSTDAGWTEVTDVTELFGKTFFEYEDCDVYYTTHFSSTGEMTSLNGSDPIPVETVKALFSTQGFTKEGNTGYAIAKPYKRTVNGVTTYAYLFNGGDKSEPRDYARLAVSQE